MVDMSSNQTKPNGHGCSSLLAGFQVCFQFPHKDYISPCWSAKNGTSMARIPFMNISSSKLHHPCPACLFRFTWMVGNMGGKWPHSCSFGAFYFQDLFKTTRQINFDYAKDLAILVNAPLQAVFLLHSLEQGAKHTGHYTNTNKSLCILNKRSHFHFNRMASEISSGSDANTHHGLSIGCQLYRNVISVKIKQDSF